MSEQLTFGYELFGIPQDGVVTPQDARIAYDKADTLADQMVRALHECVDPLERRPGSWGYMIVEGAKADVDSGLMAIQDMIANAAGTPETAWIAGDSKTFTYLNKARVTLEIAVLDYWNVEDMPWNLDYLGHLDEDELEALKDSDPNIRAKLS